MQRVVGRSWFMNPKCRISDEHDPQRVTGGRAVVLLVRRPQSKALSGQVNVEESHYG